MANQSETVRKIIHIDMDAFYASIEQRNNPEFRGKPIAVGGNRERGVIAAASYEARKYGVYSAMPTVTARRLCPDLILIQPKFDVYRKISMDIMNIFRTYTDLVEPLSLDEAFLDVTRNKRGIPSATLIAIEIRQKIKEHIHLNASAGISINKFLAKVASDMDKPDGLFVIRPEEAEKFVEQLPVEKFFGVGKVTAEKMYEMGIHTGLDLKKKSRAELTAAFGKNGGFFYNIARAIDDRPVNPERIRKSFGKESTFDEDISSLGKLKEKTEEIARLLWQGLAKSGFRGKTLTLKIKYADFRQITRNKTLTQPVQDLNLILSIAFELLKNEYSPENKIRLLGLTVSNTEKVDDKDQPLQLTIDF